MTDDIPKQVSGFCWHGVPVERLDEEQVKDALRQISKASFQSRGVASYAEHKNLLDLINELKKLKRMYDEISISPARMG